MNLINLLKSPLAIAGIVGSVAIGGGLTVYVVQDGAPGHADVFPSVFVVKSETPGRGNSKTEFHQCELDANAASGCTFSLSGNTFGPTQINFRRHDRDQSRVVLSGKLFGETIAPASYTLDIISKGAFFGSSTVHVVNWAGKEPDGK